MIRYKTRDTTTRSAIIKKATQQIGQGTNPIDRNVIKVIKRTIIKKAIWLNELLQILNKPKKKDYMQMM